MPIMDLDVGDMGFIIYGKYSSLWQLEQSSVHLLYTRGWFIDKNGYFMQSKHLCVLINIRIKLICAPLSPE